MYKKLFSNPILLRELLESFVKEEFIRELDFDTLQRLDKSFITDTFRQKESDLIYRINYREQEIYIYLLFEFQSTVDKFMAIRILRYICEFYEFLIQKKIKKLPPVFPVLLYNGDAKWTAKYNTKDLISRFVPEKYIPNFSYYPILENEIPTETLLHIRNAVAAIFYIENSSIEDTKKNIRKIINLLMTENPEVVILIRKWINNLFGYKDTEINESIKELEGTHEMFATTLKKHDEELKRISEQKGVEKGIQKGIKKGIEKGIIKGIEKGLLQGRIETAKKMHDKGFSISDIMDITGLTSGELGKAGIK